MEEAVEQPTFTEPSVLHDLTPKDIEDLNRLIPQVVSKPTQPLETQLRRVLESDTSDLIIVRDNDGRIIGSTIINICPKMGRVEGRIDDVVVDRESRGHGVGKSLVLKALTLLQEMGADVAELTSREDKVEANALYPSVGFKKRETNVYTFTFNR